MINREPMEGEELIRLSLEAFHVQLHFESTILQIGVEFRLSKSGGDEIREPHPGQVPA